MNHTDKLFLSKCALATSQPLTKGNLTPQVRPKTPPPMSGVMSSIGEMPTVPRPAQ